MTKQEKIKEVYKFYKGKVDENGWTNFMAIEYFGSNNLDSKIHKGEGLIYRHKSLQGIENNNGWVKIENENDLPKESGQYLTHRANGIIVTEWFYNNNQSWYLWKKCYSITHYQPIEKPSLPIY